MHYNLNTKIAPSSDSLVILADLLGTDQPDGSYDWADQTNDFLHSRDAAPKLTKDALLSDEAKEVFAEIVQVFGFLQSGNLKAVHEYIQNVRYQFVVGFPRTGGSYLTKEMLRNLGYDHTKITESLAHDGYPSLSPSLLNAGRSLFSLAEFIVVSKHYFAKNQGETIIIPKKFPSAASHFHEVAQIFGSSAEFLITLRHPLPTALSAADKAGSRLEKFPEKTRSAIEGMVARSLAMRGVRAAGMNYVVAFSAAWLHFYESMIDSGLFAPRPQGSKVTVLLYGSVSYETAVKNHAKQYAVDREPEAFFTRPCEAESAAADGAVDLLRKKWGIYGRQLPKMEVV